MLKVISPEVTAMIIQDEIRRNADSRYDHRLHAVLMVAQGRSCVEVAKLFGDSVRIVQKWVRDFNQVGLSALYDAPIPGRPRRLQAHHMALINATLRKNPADAGMECAIWDGVALSHWIKRELDILLGVRQCQRLFRQQAFRYRKPRPQSAKADLAKQAEYKKTRRSSRTRI
jgi:transposase